MCNRAIHFSIDKVVDFSIVDSTIYIKFIYLRESEAENAFFIQVFINSK